MTGSIDTALRSIERAEALAKRVMAQLHEDPCESCRAIFALQQALQIPYSVSPMDVVTEVLEALQPTPAAPPPDNGDAALRATYRAKQAAIYEAVTAEHLDPLVTSSKSSTRTE